MKPTAPKELNVFLKLLVVLALGGVFFLLFFSFFARVGSGIFLFSGIIPVSAGYFFGSWGGLVGGLVIFPLNFLLSRAVTGTSVEEFLWPNVAPNLGLILIGVFVGRLRETQRKLFEAKLIQEKLRESEAKFSLFMNNAPIVGWVKDPETWKYLYINKTFQTTFKIKMEEITQKRDSDLWPKEVAETLRKNDFEVYTKGKVFRIYEDVPTPDGVMHHWLVFKFPVESEGKRLVGGTAIDITALKKSQDELAERTVELERMNELMVGRESRMAELKEQIKKLKAK